MLIRHQTAAWTAVAALLAVMQLVPNARAGRYAIIGDMGGDTPMQREVTDMLEEWEAAGRLDALLTTGDNNYPNGQAENIDRNVGKYYSQWMYPYNGDYGTGATDRVNRFWPIPGNHDHADSCTDGRLGPYLDYMPVDGKRYYDVVIDDIHFFMLDIDCNEPDGITVDSIQALWLKETAADSKSPWKVVIMHKPPYSSGHGNSGKLQWPFPSWGINAVISGHDHDYERILKSGFPYFINGLGGYDIRSAFSTTIAKGSVVRWNGGPGAQLVTSSPNTLTFRFFTTLQGGTLIDCYRLHRSSPGAAVTYSYCGGDAMSVLANKATVYPAEPGMDLLFAFSNITKNSQAPVGWNSNIDFNDASWPWGYGPAPLGFGPDLPWNTFLVDNRVLGGSYLFRRRFCLTPAQLAHIQANGATLYVASDDRASVWINGVAVSEESTKTNHEIVYWNNFNLAVPTSAFKVGWNLVAAQVWNGAGSGDAGFDLDIRVPSDLWNTNTAGTVCDADYGLGPSGIPEPTPEPESPSPPPPSPPPPEPSPPPPSPPPPSPPPPSPPPPKVNSPPPPACSTSSCKSLPCCSGYSCKNGSCTKTSTASPPACSTSSCKNQPCCSGYSCKSGSCSKIRGL